MGQRHQLFVIARIGDWYRSLAAVHHQWLYGEPAVRACYRLVKIFSDPRNHGTIKHELDLAVSFFKDHGPPDDDPPEYVDVEKEACAFPFITTCLAIGAGYDFGRHTAQTVHELAYNTGYDQEDNNDGITVLDITDLSNVRYCFVKLWSRLQPSVSFLDNILRLFLGYHEEHDDDFSDSSCEVRINYRQPEPRLALRAASNLSC